jgi:two-component system, LytTR family, response regulator
VTLRVVIADDEPPARARLRRLLAHHADIHIVAECGDGASTVQAIEAEAPDLVLLDIQMPELDGFEVLQALDVPQLPAIIFVSAFDQYALRAFRVHALDYVLKPVEPDRLDEALAHARLHVPGRRTTAANAAGVFGLLQELARKQPYLTRVPVRTEGRVVVIDLAEVDWISAADNYVTLHVGPRSARGSGRVAASAREFLVRDTIAYFDRRLDPDRFVRIHRSTIVQIDRIAELVPDFHGDFTIRLRDGTSLALSRTFRARVEERFGRRL